MHLNSGIVRPLAAGLAAALVLIVLAPAAPAGQSGTVKIRASETALAVDGRRDFSLPSGTTHIAIHWPGHADAVVKAAFSTGQKRCLKRRCSINWRAGLGPALLPGSSVLRKTRIIWLT